MPAHDTIFTRKFRVSEIPIRIIKDGCENSPNHIPELSVDLFFCDPPYFISGGKGNSIINEESGDRQDWDRQWKNKEEFYEWTERWMRLMFSQLKQAGSAYVCISWEHSGKFQEILERVGFKIQNRITWKRDKGRGSKSNWKNMHEDVWFVTKHTTEYTFNIDQVMVEKEVVAPYRDAEGNPKDWFVTEDGRKVRMTYPGNLWTEFTVPFWSMKEVRSYAKTKKTPENELPKHNTQKPKDLVKKCIKASSLEGELVVDYFFGSGTTAVASNELNRRFIGFDISDVCVKMAEKRLFTE